jgi:hypothetical protein
MPVTRWWKCHSGKTWCGNTAVVSSNEKVRTTSHVRDTVEFVRVKTVVSRVHTAASFLATKMCGPDVTCTTPSLSKLSDAVPWPLALWSRSR